jgi:hypothetical protein
MDFLHLGPIRKLRNSANGIDNFGGTLTVRNCVISGNSRDGIYNYTQEFGVVTATIFSTTVSGNSYRGVFTQPNIFSGGATVTITDCTISGNFFASGGGRIFGTATFLTVANNTISGNSTGGSGGGILVGPSLVPGSSIVNSTISGNSAGTSGGAVSSLPLRRCALQIARSPAIRQLLAGASITTGRLTSLTQS